MALTLIISATAFCARINAQVQDNLVLFWNLENFFDWTDGGNGDSDTEFTPGGKRRWTARKFYSKCNAVAKSVLWISDEYGKLPDVIGLAEIENRGVLSKLISSFQELPIL